MLPMDVTMLLFSQTMRHVVVEIVVVEIERYDTIPPREPAPMSSLDGNPNQLALMGDSPIPPIPTVIIPIGINIDII